MPIPFSDVPAFRRDPLRLLLERSAAYSPGFAPLHLGMKPIWLVTDATLARMVLKWPTDEIDKGRLVQTLQPLVGSSLLTNVGDEHQRAKHAIHRHVHRNAVAHNIEPLLAVLTNFVARLTREGEVHTDRDLPALAFQLACVVVFGHDVINTADRTTLIGAVRTLEAEVASSIFRLPLLPRWPGEAKRRAMQLDFARQVVALVVSKARMSEKRSGVIRGLEEAGLSDAAIEAEILGLLIAGHHTSGATMGWLVHHMAEDPEIAEMIAIEADEALPLIEAGDFGALKRSSLSLAFVNEVLRLYPAGWWTSREVYMPTSIGGTVFAVGDMMMISPWQLHRDPRYWVQPDRFQIDRSYCEDAFMPFGIGPRACVGTSIAMFELQMFVLQLAAALRFTRVRSDFPKPKPSITLLFPDTHYEVTMRQSKTGHREAA